MNAFLRLLPALAVALLAGTPPAAGQAVNPTPSILESFILSPAHESTVPYGTPILVSALVTGGSVGLQTEFYANGVVYSTNVPGATPVGDPFTPPEPGIYYFYTRSFDNFSNNSYSDPIRVFVTGTRIVGPRDGSIVPVGSSVVFHAAALGARAPIQGVQFYVDGSPAGSPDLVAPYSFLFTMPPGAADGSVRTVTAVATDYAGNPLPASNAVDLFALAPAVGTPAIPLLLSPEAGSPVPTGLVTPITVRVPDPDQVPAFTGRVTKVEFYIDGDLVSTVHTFPYTFPWQPRVSGTYDIVALAFDDRGNQTATEQRTISVTDSQPTVAVVRPLPNAAVPAGVTGASTLIEASAAGADGAGIVAIEYFVGLERVAVFQALPDSVLLPPFEFTGWQPSLPAGVSEQETSIQVRITDENGLTATSLPVAIRVFDPPPPTVTLESPDDGSIVNLGDTVTVVARVGDENGIPLDSVTFQRVLPGGGNQEIATAFDPAPGIISATFLPPAIPGSYTIRVEARSASGKTGSSSLATITVPPVPIPVATFTQPADNATIGTVGVPVFLEGTATVPAGGTLVAVDFVRGGQIVGAGERVGLTSRYRLAWVPTAPGTYDITLRATGAGGGVGTSTPRTITIREPVDPVPSISIVNPLPGAVVTTFSTVNLVAAAVGSGVAGVDFFVDGTYAGAATKDPGSSRWRLATPLSFGDFGGPGTRSVVAVARDAQSNVSNSAALAVTVAPSLSESPEVSAGVFPATALSGQLVTLAAVASAAQETDVSRVDFFANGVFLGTDSTAPFRLGWFPGRAGAYEVLAVASDFFGNQTVSATVAASVSAGVGEPPTVALSSPAADLTFTSGSSILLAAQAVDEDGTVASVRFFADGVLLGTDTASPWEVVWTPALSGDYLITVEATDEDGNVAVSDAVGLTVIPGALPAGSFTVDLITPLSGSRYVAGAPIELQAATNIAPVANPEVRFVVNGLELEPLAAPPYVAERTITVPGTYSIRAIVRSPGGNAAVSAPATVTIDPNLVPVVAIDRPVAGGTVEVNQPVTIAVSASDPDGLVSSVQVRINEPVDAFNTVTILPVTGYPYEVQWTPGRTGTFTLTATVTDNSGAVATSAPIQVTASAPGDLPAGAPTAELLLPASAQSYTAGSGVLLAARATDDDGTIDRVEFYADSTLVATVTTEPYEAVWSAGPTGQVDITARAIDNEGKSSDSSAVSLTVTPATAPSGSYTAALLAPTAGATVVAGAPFELRATTNIPAAANPSVTFVIDGRVVAVDATSPFSVQQVIAIPGPHVVRAQVRSPQGDAAVAEAVVVTVVPNLLPEAVITRPSAGAAAFVGRPLGIEVQASDPDGAVSSVEVRVVGGPAPVILTDTTYPYEVVWTPGSLGTFAITATVTDSSGAATVTGPVAVTTSDPEVVAPGSPFVVLANPAADRTYLAGSQVLLAAEAVDEGGSIDRVEFHAGGVLVGTDATPPYAIVWMPDRSGEVDVSARAIDDEGNISDSIPVALLIVPSALPPGSVTVNLLSPLDGDGFVAGAGFELRAVTNLSPTDLPRVRFFVNSVATAADTTEPYSLDRYISVPGTYTVRAVVETDDGLAAVSAPAVITIRPNAAPLVAIAEPSMADFGYTNRSVAIEIEATDPDGSIAEVQVRVDQPSGQPHTFTVLTTGDYPYTATWTPSAVGTYTLRATATDNAGGVTLSAPVAITVVDPERPAAGQPPIVHAGEYAGGFVAQGGIAIFIEEGRVAHVLGYGAAVTPGSFFVPGAPVGTDGSIAINAAAGQPGVRVTAGATGFAGQLFSPDAITAGAVRPPSGAAEAYTGVYEGTAGGIPFHLMVAPDGATYAALGGDSPRGGAGSTSASGAFSVFLTGSTTLAGTIAPDGTVSGALSGSLAGPVSGFRLAPADRPAAPVNLSARGLVGTGEDVLIVGFVIEGTGVKRLLLRGAGPALAGFGVPGVLADPVLTLFDDAGASITANDNWGASPGADVVASEAARLGAFAFAPDSRDAATVVELAPGAYTAVIQGVGGSTGVALFEVYDADDARSATARLANLSARAAVGTGPDILIPGVVVQGAQPSRFLVRGVGPALASFGVGAPLAATSLTLFQGGSRVAANTAWGTSVFVDAIRSASASAGAFPLPEGGADSALLLTLPTGAYTLQLTGPGDATGIGLIELYAVPSN